MLDAFMYKNGGYEMVEQNKTLENVEYQKVSNASKEFEGDPSRIYLGETKEIDLPKLDLTKFIGRRVKIEGYSEHEKKFDADRIRYYVKVWTQAVDKLPNGTELRATRLFGFVKNIITGEIGWTSGSKLATVLNKYKVKHYKDLVGIEVPVQMETIKSKRDGSPMDVLKW